MAFGLSTENGINWEELKKNSKLAADLLTLACFVVFAVLTGCDLKRAFIKRATWLPGKSFALSGVTVQIIAWWTSLSNIYNDYSGKFDTLVWENYMVVSGRVAVCVFVGYLLPEMAAESVMAFWALAITISAQIVSELHVLSNGSTDYEEERERGDLSEYLDGILLVCIIVLGVILCCTVLASKTIRGLMRERILAIAKESKFELRSLYSITGQEKFQSSDENMETTWDDFKDEVLRSWFVARASQIDYVISRSVLSSVVWIILTICSIVTICSIALSELEIELYGAISPLLSFIAIGYLVIWWRWLVAQLYFGPHGQNWRERLCVEGFWTSYIVELIDMYEERRLQRSNSKISWLNNSESLSTKIITIVRLHNLLYLVLMFQVCVVFFINVCGLLSEVTVGRFLYWCRERMSKEDLVTSHENYERILKSLSMPREDPSALWEANKIALNKAKKLMDIGCVEGSSSCKEIHSLLDSYSVQWAKDGTQLLKLLRGKALPSVLSKFPSVEEQCLKMTIVSLLTIFLRLHKAKSNHLTKVVKACCQVWDLVSFADEYDIDLQPDKIKLLDDLKRDNDQVCVAANWEFSKLQMQYNNKLSSESDSCVEDVHGLLKELLNECEDVLKEANLLQGNGNNKFHKDLRDSRNWMKIAPRYALYKLCNVMLSEDIKDFVK